MSDIESSDRELHYSGLTILSVAMGPLSFILLQENRITLWISFPVFFGFCVLGFFFQSIRRRETRRLRQSLGPKKFSYQVGDEIQYQGMGFVVLKLGFNHYYLKPIERGPNNAQSFDQIILVKRARVEYAGTRGQVRARETQIQQSF